MPRGPHICDGGPLDGHMVTPAPGRYTWVGRKLTTHAGDTLRPLLGQRPVFTIGAGVASAPRSGFALYELTSDGLVYAGHRVYICPGCGCYHHKCEGGSERPPCALGGSDSR